MPMIYCYLELLKSESSTKPDLGVVLEGGTMNYGSKPATDGTRCYLACLLNTCVSSADLAGRLVEPGLHPSLPVFVEVPIRDHIITFGRHLGWKGS